MLLIAVVSVLCGGLTYAYGHVRRLRSLESLQARIDEFQPRHDALRTQVAKAIAELAALDSELVGARTTIARRDGAAVELGILTSQAEETRQRVAAADSAYQTIWISLADAKGLHETTLGAIAQQRELLDAVIADLSPKISAHARIGAEIVAATNELNGLKAEIAEHQGTLETLREAVAEAERGQQAGVVSSQLAIQTAEADSATAQGLAAEARKTLKDLQESIKTYRERGDDALRIAATYETRAIDAQATWEALATSKAELEQIGEALRTAKQERDAAIQARDAALVERQRTSGTHASVTAELSAARETLDRERRALQTVQATRTEADREVVRLEGRVQQLTGEIARLQAERDRLDPPSSDDDSDTDGS